MNKETDGVIAIIGCIGFIPAIVFGYVIRAWAIVTLWAWFATPFLHVSAPGYPIALGIAMLGNMLTGEKGNGSTEKYDSVAASVAAVYAKILLGPVITVCIGWAIRQWM